MSKEKIVYTCKECDDYNICPHSYREHDLEKENEELKLDNKELKDRIEIAIKMLKEEIDNQSENGITECRFIEIQEWLEDRWERYENN